MVASLGLFGAKFPCYVLITWEAIEFNVYLCLLTVWFML